jgi:hypothetical protein
MLSESNFRIAGYSPGTPEFVSKALDSIFSDQASSENRTGSKMLMKTHLPRTPMERSITTTSSFG